MSENTRPGKPGPELDKNGYRFRGKERASLKEWLAIGAAFVAAWALIIWGLIWAYHKWHK